ncbi:hypothetical protein BLGI_2646 [Brevibacillus laterosporus GI-9]|nr:hypothetical protein BLGI_2646 [Brevibacillus laterosporus GI-9]
MLLPASKDTKQRLSNLFSYTTKKCPLVKACLQMCWKAVQGLLQCGHSFDK